MTDFSSTENIRDVLAEKQTDFAFSLLRSHLPQADTGNFLLSPLSAAAALSMSALGAKGDTRGQMESLLSGGLSAHHLTRLVAESYSRFPLSAAASVWLRQSGDFTADPLFLRRCREESKADLFLSPFDQDTVQAMNDWCRDKTEGVIPSLVETLDKRDRVHLLSAVSFHGTWAVPYPEDARQTDVFTAANGRRQQASYLSSQEDRYISDGEAVGFVKPYAGYRYAFAALLPKEGSSPRQLCEELTGHRWRTLLADSRSADVHVRLPVFTARGTADLVPAVKALGVTDAFDPDKADFSAMGTVTSGNLCIGNITHKTRIKVDITGTQAAAATDVGMIRTTALLPEQEIYWVDLNRPFLYAIVDTYQSLPVFLGILDSLDG